MNTRVTHAIVAIAIGGLVLSACGSQGPAVDAGDKTGAETVVLRFATFDGSSNPLSPGVAAFIETLESASDGGFKVEVTYAYGDGAPDAESRLIQAIASGDVDGGWASTRAFAEAGIEGLDAVEAPLTITNYEAMKELVAGPVADRVLAALDGSGVVGLGLDPSDLRRPFAADSFLLEPDDWDGITFRSYNSPTQTEAIEALGGTAVQLSFDWVSEAAAGRLDGIEIGIPTYAANGFSTEVPYVTANVVLWPKVHVILMSQEQMDSLTDEQRAWVEQATEAARRASVEADYDESEWARQLCDAGVRFAEATDDQLAAMRAALQPVLDRLADADSASGALLADIQAIAAEQPDIEVPDVPTSCRAEVAGGDLVDIPDEISAMPDGTYRTEIRLADVEAAGVDNGPGWTGTWTLTIEGGTYILTCLAIEAPGKDCGNTTYEGPLEAGRLLGDGSVAYFDFDEELMSNLTGCELPATGKPGHCYSAETYWATWLLDGDRLTFSDPGGPFGHHLTLSEWRKIN